MVKLILPMAQISMSKLSVIFPTLILKRKPCKHLDANTFAQMSSITASLHVDTAFMKCLCCLLTCSMIDCCSYLSFFDSHS